MSVGGFKSECFLCKGKVFHNLNTTKIEDYKALLIIFYLNNSIAI